MFEIGKMMEEYTFEKAVEYILEIPKFSGKNSLEATREFYKYLGKPSEKSKAIHVAGTNGKGSVCAFTASVLMEAGFSVGMFTSPHLVSICERIKLCGKDIDKEAFLDVFTELSNYLEVYRKDVNPEYHPSFFEWLFFMAALYYEKTKPDYILWETGLGGRLDATNILENQVASVITQIGLDHMEYLGNTVEEIALEKAGIMRKYVPVIFYPFDTVAFKVLIDEALRSRATINFVDTYRISFLNFGDKTIDFSMYTRYYGYISLRLNTIARYQVANAALAVKVISHLPDTESITKEHIIKGIAATKWPGRMEEVAPGVFLEGAHNPDGIDAFLDTIREMTGKKKHLLFAVVSDKQYDEMIKRIALADLFQSYTVTTVGGARGLSTTQVRGLFEQYTDKEVNYEEDIVTAYKKCCDSLGEDEQLFVAGSLYLVGQVKEYLGSLEA